MIQLKAKPSLLKTSATISPLDLLSGLIVIAVAVYFLAPGNWEPGGESLKNWVGARIFRETGGFPVISFGPLYNLYLQIFLSFPYPLSIQLEHAVTHLAAYVALLVLLRRFLPQWPALVLLCAWIPVLYTVEGGARVAGIGCLALYLARDTDSPWCRGWVPVPLFCAALFDVAFIPFLGGHVVGTAVLRLRNNQPLWTGIPRLESDKWAPWLAKAFLVALIVATAFFQSPRPDNNIHGFEYPWAPVPLKNALTASSIQVANGKYVISHYPESQRMYKDWYETNNEAFGGAQTLWSAIRYNPGLYLRSILTEARVIIVSPAQFLISFQQTPTVRWLLKPPLLLLMTLGGYWALRRYWSCDEAVKAFSLGIGTVGVATGLTLVYFSTRYIMVLLPFWLLAAVHVGPGLRSLGAVARRGSLEEAPYRKESSALDLGVIYAIAFLVFTAAQPSPWVMGENLLQRNPYELRGNLWRERGPLLESLGRGKRVLAMEEAWIRTFADVDIEKVYNPLYLPPFKDATGDTERFLENLDVIWVNDAWTRPIAQLGTQGYLRYYLHVEPFLRRAVDQGWTREDVPGFGQIYKRPVDLKHG